MVASGKMQLHFFLNMKVKNEIYNQTSNILLRLSLLLPADTDKEGSSCAVWEQKHNPLPVMSLEACVQQQSTDKLLIQLVSSLSFHPTPNPAHTEQKTAQVIWVEGLPSSEYLVILCLAI